jgi:hypothetical protein
MAEGKSGEAARERARRTALWLWLAVWPVAIGLALNPVSTRLTRGGTILCVALLAGGGLYLLWRRRPLRYGLMAVYAVALILPCLPGRAYDREALRQAYVRALYRYEGVAYVWGGEKELGVDCSGFPRRALIRANLSQGLSSFNGTLLREGLWQWWHDASARALCEEYRGRTRRLFSEESVNGADLSRLQPGDLAITSDGVHVLVYGGGKDWLEADPGIGRVIRVAAPAEGNGWFLLSVRIVRWTQF